MKNGAIRPLLGPSVICLSALIATQVYVVEPMKARLLRSKRQTDAAVHDVARMNDLNMAISDLRVRLEAAEGRVEEIKTAGQIVRNQGLLFERIWDLGNAVDVSVERIDPQMNGRGGGAVDGVESLRCSIEASGGYGAVSSFVRSLEAELGITFVRSLHIVPGRDAEARAVIASIETEHFAIDPSAASEGGN